MDIIFILSKIVFAISTILMIFAVLIQESKGGGGMGGLFGGGASSIVGPNAKNFFSKFTVWLAIAMLSSCLILYFE